jgi:hypothetical protein
MDRLDHLLITRIVRNVSCVRERARLSCISKDWKDCVRTSWTEIEVDFHSMDVTYWLVDVLDATAGHLGHLSLRFQGNP